MTVSNTDSQVACTSPTAINAGGSSPRICHKVWVALRDWSPGASYFNTFICVLYSNTGYIWLDQNFVFSGALYTGAWGPVTIKSKPLIGGKGWDYSLQSSVINVGAGRYEIGNSNHSLNMKTFPEQAPEWDMWWINEVMMAIPCSWVHGGQWFPDTIVTLNTKAR